MKNNEYKSKHNKEDKIMDYSKSCEDREMPSSTNIKIMHPDDMNKKGITVDISKSKTGGK
jgi:hypothetical protein